MRRRSITLAVAWSVAAAVLLPFGVAGQERSRQDRRPLDARASDTWQRLPDGRVVIEVHGYRLAFAPDLRSGEVAFDIVPGAVPVDLHRVLAEPAWARERFRDLPVVWVFLVNTHTLPGRFLDRFERHAVPSTHIFRIGLYADRSATARDRAWETGRRLYDRVAELARNPPALDANGFVVDRPEFMRGLGFTVYVFPAAERLSATGEPVFLACHDGLGFCRNAVDHLGDGEFARPGVRLLHQFLTHTHPQSGWRGVDAAFRVVLDDILLEDSSAPRP